MHHSLLLAGAGLAQVAFGQLHHDAPHDKRAPLVVGPVSIGGASVSYVTVTKTLAGACTPSSTFATSATSSTRASSAISATRATSASSVASAAATTSTAASSKSGISKTNLTPNGKKAGLSGFVNIDYYPAFKQLAPYISWYSDYYPNTPDSAGVKGVGMLWGATGSACVGTYEDALSKYQSMINSGTVPDIMFGFYEPDCYCSSSSQMSVAAAAYDWTSLIAPLSSKGTVLGSPSMCKQYDEDFLTPFKQQTSVGWDVTSIHINKPNLSETMKDIDYYWNKYQKPIWVSEFACVHDQPSWNPCTDQSEINAFINAVVPYFESNPHVVAYGASNGEGLGNTWPLIDAQTTNLSATGLTYLNAIKNL